MRSVILGTGRNITEKKLHGRMEEKTCWIYSRQKLPSLFTIEDRIKTKFCKEILKSTFT